MDVFNNREIPGYEELVSYGPSWWTEYREMDAIYRFAGWTLDLMALWLEKIVLNQFPIYADEETIAMLERILVLEPEPGDSLEERRRTVAAYYPGNGKFGASTIKSIIKAYSGCDSEIWWEDNILQIRIILDEDAVFSARKIENILLRRMPAHVATSFRDLLIVFVLTEYFVERITFRTPISAWQGLLDGSMLLDGTYLLNTELPTRITFVPKLTLTNENMWIYATTNRFISRATSDEDLTLTDVYKVDAIWWDSARLLGGWGALNGEENLDDALPPDINISGWRYALPGEEAAVFNWYVPAEAVPLTGAVMLDGNINLNSGREEL